jgi:hypothetical protein
VLRRERPGPLPAGRRPRPGGDRAAGRLRGRRELLRSRRLDRGGRRSAALHLGARRGGRVPLALHPGGGGQRRPAASGCLRSQREVRPLHQPARRHADRRLRARSLV